MKQSVKVVISLITTLIIILFYQLISAITGYPPIYSTFSEGEYFIYFFLVMFFLYYAFNKIQEEDN